MNLSKELFKENIRNRLLELYKALEPKKKQLALKLGITVQNLNGRTAKSPKTGKYNTPSMEHLAKLALAYPNRINYEYLFTGKGSPLFDKNNSNQYEGNFVKADIINETTIKYHKQNHPQMIDEKDKKIMMLQEENRILQKKIIQMLEARS